MKTVLVSVSNNIANDQRLARTCITLHQNGYKIVVFGRKKQENPILNLPYQTKRFKLPFYKGFLFYAFFNIRLFFALLFTKKDILFANDLDTLLPNFLVSKLQRKSLVFDSHELFSEVPELQTKLMVKKIWKGLEDFLIPRVQNVITVSGAIQLYYKKQYNIDAVLLRNVPVFLEVMCKPIPGISNKQKIIWYQGSVNLGRGLELMIDTMALLEDFMFVIAGEGDVLELLEQKVLSLQLDHKIKFLGKLSPKELRTFTPNAAIGISLEEDLGLNYRYALPNKLFDYIQAEVPVIVSNLPEMASLVLTHKVGEVLTERTPRALSELLLKITQIDYSLALKKAKKQFTWDKEKKRLINLINQLPCL